MHGHFHFAGLLPARAGAFAAPAFGCLFGAHTSSFTSTIGVAWAALISLALRAADEAVNGIFLPALLFHAE